MKTKLLLPLFFLFFIVENTFSQTYYPLLNNATWNIVSANFGGSQNFVMGPGTDYVIGTHTYKKFIDPTLYNTTNYIREDVATKRVYRNVSGVDQLLFDFSLQVGDHITLGDGKDYTVQSITNANVNGGTRRMFSLINYIGTFAGNSETWIEGVGNLQHPLKPKYELIYSDPYIYMSCSAQNGLNVFNQGIMNAQPTPTDCSMLLSVEELNELNNEIVYAPNPFQNELMISTKMNLQDASLKIYNSIGQLVKEQNNMNGENAIVKRDHLMSGIYFAQLLQNGKVISTQKLIVAE